MVRWGHLIRTVIGVLLIPLCAAAAITFGKAVLATEAERWHVVLALILGAGGYVLIFIFLHRSLVRTIFSKEGVAMMWSSITGYRLPIEPPGGRPTDQPTDVKGRRMPLWAVMLPYLVPIYSVVGALIVWIVKLVLGGRFSNANYQLVQAFVLGLTYAFHVFYISLDIRDKNPHLRSAGYLFTLALMFLINIEMLAALAMLVFRVNWLDFNVELLIQAKHMYRWFWHFNYNPFR